MSHVILIRHAAPVIEPDRPSETWGLSDDGRTATALLAQALARYAPRRILCGSEPKMAGTAKVLSEQLGIAVQHLGGLNEHTRRTTKFTDKAAFEAAIRALFARPGEIVYGEESANMTYARLAATLDSALVHEAGTVAAVTGGTALSIFLARRTGAEAFTLWQGLRLPMAFVLARGTWAIENVI
ncbi:MAG TPA: histidine phosphatase family protein [Rhizomicrobium sp.]|jgi:broad specificity phosphatase PhoE|nr:histidine phosphatase family protein [Rhizomicrobium sp.]